MAKLSSRNQLWSSFSLLFSLDDLVCVLKTQDCLLKFQTVLLMLSLCFKAKRVFFLKNSSVEILIFC